MSGAHICTPIKQDNEKIDVANSPLYYGICMPDHAGEAPNVFIDKTEVLKQVKKYPGARFKAFASLEEAYSFSSSYFNIDASTPVENNKNFEKPLAFKAPKSQEIVKLRKAIELGDVQAFFSTVWSNPRYLIASGDTPTIMQEGFRYTALHVAARSNQPVICKMILNVIQDLKFLQLLYDDDPVTVQERRMEFLTDLYLNLPDKGLCETPLHFACKFGCVKVVQVLLSYPACDRTRMNKYKQTAHQIICDRFSTPSGSLKKEIDNLFEDRYYVPVLRSEDNSVTPVLGKPFSPESSHTLPLSNSSSPMQSPLRIKALAGPMSPELATQFYKEWKGSSSSPLSRVSCKIEKTVRRTDSGKGLERVGRILAKEHQVKWNEYWPFLDTWCNFTTSSGLIALEQHFKEVNKQIIQNNMNQVLLSLDSNSNYKEKTPDKKKCCSNVSSTSDRSIEDEMEFSPVTRLCKDLENFHISSCPKSRRKPLSSPDTKRRAKIISGNIAKECDPIRRALNFDSPYGERTRNRLETQNCETMTREEDEHFVNIKESFRLEKNLSDEMFYTPPNSPSHLESPLHTPEEMQLFFIMGSNLTKVDFDVLNALDGINVDPCSYPLVFLWKENLSVHPYNQMSGSFTPHRVENCSFQSLPPYKICESPKSRQHCWTFPMKRKKP